MLLISSITRTKKFFQKTLKNFKSLFSSGYQKLPKSTYSHNHLSCSLPPKHVMDMDMDMNINNKIGSDIKLSNANACPSKEKNQVKKSEVFDNKNNENRFTTRFTKGQKPSKMTFTEGISEGSIPSGISNDMKERRYCIVEEKLRELEMLDISNVDYVMDIEEILHYYSKLNCPEYLDIVDRFLMEMCFDKCERF